MGHHDDLPLRAHSEVGRATEVGCRLPRRVRVRQVPLRVHLQATHHSDVDMPAADDRERFIVAQEHHPRSRSHRAVPNQEDVGIDVLPTLQEISEAEKPVFGVQQHLDVRRDDVRAVHRQADPKVHDGAVEELACHDHRHHCRVKALRHQQRASQEEGGVLGRTTTRCTYTPGVWI